MRPFTATTAASRRAEGSEDRLVQKFTAGRVQRTAWLGPPTTRLLLPTTCPLTLIPNAADESPPRERRLFITPLYHTKAVPPLEPTTCPLSLIALATLMLGPVGPKSRILPASHRNACRGPVAVTLCPTTWS